MPKNKFYDENEEIDEQPSRSEIKRESIAFQTLGMKVVDLSAKNLQKIPLWEELDEAVTLARRLPNKDAKRRQIRRIGKLLRNGDSTPISNAIDKIDQDASLQNHRFHALEKLRDSLVAEGDEAIQTVIEKYQNADRSELRQLTRNAKKEASQNKPPKSARKLFNYLRELDKG